MVVSLRLQLSACFYGCCCYGSFPSSAAPRGLTAQLLQSLVRAAASRCGSRGGRLQAQIQAGLQQRCCCFQRHRQTLVHVAWHVTGACAPRAQYARHGALICRSFLSCKAVSFPSTCRNSEPCHREFHRSETCVWLKALACKLK